MQRPGNTIVEVLLAIGIASIVVASVGNLIVAVNRVDRTSAHRDQALGYAREALEVVAAIADGEFARTTNCGTTGYGAVPTGYNSCWSACPTSGCSAVYHVEKNLSGDWEILAGNELVPANNDFTRTIVLAPVDSDHNVKKVTSTVSWTERNQPRTVIQETIVSGWKNNPTAP